MVRKIFFELSFDIFHALIGLSIVEKTVFEAGEEAHMSLILLSTEVIRI